MANCRDACMSCLILERSGRQLLLDGKTFLTYSRVDCTTAGMVYVIVLKCGKYYIGSTRDCLRKIIKDLRSAAKKGKTGFYQHMQTCSVCSWATSKLFVLAQGDHIAKEKESILKQLPSDNKCLNTKMINGPKGYSKFDKSFFAERTHVTPFFPERTRRFFLNVVESPLYHPMGKRTKEQTAALLLHIENLLHDMRKERHGHLQ